MYRCNSRTTFSWNSQSVKVKKEGETNKGKKKDCLFFIVISVILVRTGSTNQNGIERIWLEKNPIICIPLI